MDDPQFGYRFLIVAFLLLLNGFFAGAEVALLSVRQSRLKELAASGRVGAKAALSLLEHPERLLSVVQVGVTLTSLGLGWAGEATLFRLFQAMLAPFVALNPVMEGALHGASFALAFAAMIYAHVVIGEVVPKNLAIERADHLAIIVAPVLLAFYKVVTPFVFVIERSAGGLSRLLGLKGRLGGGHSAEELKFILSDSRRRGHIESFEEMAIKNLIDLRDYLVREIMVPRSEVISVPIDASLDDILRVGTDHQLSRIPVYEGEPERIIGIVHAKDLLTVWRRWRSAGRPGGFNLRFMISPPFVVPETKPVNQLIDEFREKRSHMALVVDEFGAVVGVVTLEDVLEQIFGEIEDEHDVHLPPAESAPVLELDGGFNIRDLQTQYGIELPVDAGFETLAGFILSRLGHIPEAGAEIEYEGYRFTVLEMEKNRIAKVLVVRLDGQEAAEQPA